MCPFLICGGLLYITANNCLNHLKLYRLETTRHYAKYFSKVIVAVVIMSVTNPFNRFYEIKHNLAIACQVQLGFSEKKISHSRLKILVIKLISSAPGPFNCKILKRGLGPKIFDWQPKFWYCQSHINLDFYCTKFYLILTSIYWAGVYL